MTDALDSTTAVAPGDEAQPPPTHFELKEMSALATGCTTSFSSRPTWPHDTHGGLAWRTSMCMRCGG